MVEQGFDTLYSSMSAMVAHVGLQEKIRTGICPECAPTATNLENILVNPHEEKCAHEKFYGKILDYAKYLRTFG